MKNRHETRPCGPPKNHEPHPLANLVPMASDTELAELRTSLEVNGLIDPLVLYQGQILDGRNRSIACRSDITRRYVEYVGDAPAAYVLARSTRRNLTPTQRAMLASKFIEPLREEAEARMKRGTLAPAGARVGKAAEEAAEAAGVSTRSVERAAAVRRDGAPELVEAVEKGAVSLFAASELKDLPLADQLEALTRDDQARAAMAKALRAAKKRGDQSALTSSEDNEWYTPRLWTDAVRSVMPDHPEYGRAIRLDPASCAAANELVGAFQFFTESDNGTEHDWIDGWFCNPPYGRTEDHGSSQGRWLQHAIAQFEARRRGVFLCNVLAKSRWFDAVYDFPRAYVKVDFVHHERGVQKQGSYGQVFVFMNDDPTEVLRFKAKFESLGCRVDIPVAMAADIAVASLIDWTADDDEERARLREHWAEVRTRFERAERIDLGEAA